MYMPNAQYRRFGSIITVLCLSYGLLLFWAGFDKLLDWNSVEWFKFISPVISYSLPLSYSQMLMGVSIIQMILGILLILPRFAKLGAYLSAIFLGFFAMNLFSMGFQQSWAVLNTMLAISMLVLGELLSIKEGMRDSAS